jgi:hypothetical protein
VQQTALQEKPHEDPTIGILVVQVRRIRAISGEVLRRPNAAFLTRYPHPEEWPLGRVSKDGTGAVLATILRDAAQARGSSG